MSTNPILKTSSSLDDIAAALGFDGDAGGRRDVHCYGRVEDVNADGSYQVKLNASSIATRCAACCDAEAGDRVLVLIMANGRCAAIGRVR